MKVLVIIPCYNEAENICRVVQRLKATCPDVDYLVVNDCSTDDSARILRENGYNYLDLPLNLGNRRRRAERLSVRHGQRL